MGIAEYFQYAVFDFRLFAVPGVGEHCVFCWQRQLRREPLNRVQVNHSLHIKQVNGDFDCVTLADLVDWLNIRSVY